jgi:hypothetical protein
VVRDFHAGETVYVYRKPLPRKGGGQDGRVAQWCGPGTIVIQEGPNVWVAMRRERWKCAKEQVRSATREEEETYGLLKDEFKELQAELGRKGSKRGFKDISNWQFPPTAEDEPPQDTEEPVERPAQRPRLEHQAQEDSESPGPLSQEGASTPETPASTASSSSSASSPSNGHEEGKLGTPTAIQPQPVPEEVMERATTSVMRNERLDGVRQGFNPTRNEVESMRFSPYDSSMWTFMEEDSTVEVKEDEWVFHEATRSLLRIHHQERRGAFLPHDKLGCPIPVKHLHHKAVVYQHFPDGGQKLSEVSWTKQREEVGPKRYWVGFTEFKLKPKVSMHKAMEIFAANKGSDEVKESDIKPEEWPPWKVADGEEWAKVEASGAVKAQYPEESEEIERQLREAGTSGRILPSRKPAELPGEPPTMKSRWCIRGDKDPDILSLDRYSPTVTTAVDSIVLQTAASRKFRCAIGDLKDAFMQSSH